MSNIAVKEVEAAGSGYDIQATAFQRLGQPVTEEFYQASTSGQILAFTEKYHQQMTEEEIKELRGYADYIGLQFGFQD